MGELKKIGSGVLGDLKKIGFWILVALVLLTLPHVIWPEMDVKMNSVRVGGTDTELVVDHFELDNQSLLDLKDPEVTCEMKGPSGTVIGTSSQTLYELLPAGKKRSFDKVPMGNIPEQATQFRCYLRRVSVYWGGQ